MHKDQQRVREVLLPFVMDQIMASTPEAVRDCTVLNRALIQGPDPLFLLETCPEPFARICATLGLTAAEGRDAIEQAHVRGPGALLDSDPALGPGVVGHPVLSDADYDEAIDILKQEGLLGQEGPVRGPSVPGLPFDLFDSPVFAAAASSRAFGERIKAIPIAWRREALWLILAGCSDCTEQGYRKDTSLVERFRRVARASAEIELTAGALETGGEWEALGKAAEQAGHFDATTLFTFDERGFPHSDADHAFYVGYRRGYKVVAVAAGDKVYWGTTPDTTLAEQGVTVDHVISPSYGYVQAPGR